MRSQAERDLCARDPALPGLAAVLRAAALARASGLGRLVPCYLRYKPGTSCLAALRPAGGGLGAWAIATYPADRYAEKRDRTAGRGTLLLDDVPAICTPMEHDRRIRAARRLADPALRAALLAGLGLDGCRLTLLRYKPGRRIVLRADAADGPRALIKLLTRGAFDRTVSGARHGEAIGGPAILALWRSRAAIALEWRPGIALDAAHPAPGDMDETGAALARLHARRRRKLPKATDGDLSAEAETLAWLRPDLAARVRPLAARLDAMLGGDGGRVTLHGDFSADQVILGPDGAVIIDLDRICRGAPERDLASFLARLDLDGVQGKVTEGAARARAEALLAGYARHRPHDPDRLRARRARALLALATDGFRARRPDWPAECDAILDRIEALLPQTRGLAAASDCAAMAPRFAALGLGRPSRIEVLREKPGRRALLAYETDRGTILGKLRHKGADRRTPALHRALRAAGLDGRHGAVAVPPVLGELEAPPLWLQPRLEGQTLAERLDGVGGIDGAARAGRALAALHAAGVDPRRVWSDADEAETLAHVLRRAVRDDPGLRVALEAIGAAARRWLGQVPRDAVACLHRDFYFDQIILGPETTWLIDLDLAASGTAALDLGNFLAHLTELGLRRGTPGAYDAHGAAFLSGYADRRRLPDREAIACHHAVSLARHVGLSRGFADRRHTTGPLLELCRKALVGRVDLLAGTAGRAVERLPPAGPAAAPGPAPREVEAGS